MPKDTVTLIVNQGKWFSSVFFRLSEPDTFNVISIQFPAARARACVMMCVIQSTLLQSAKLGHASSQTAK